MTACRRRRVERMARDFLYFSVKTLIVPVAERETTGLAALTRNSDHND